MRINKIDLFIQFEIDGLKIINGGIKALEDHKTIIITDCGSDNEDAMDDD